MLSFFFIFGSLIAGDRLVFSPPRFADSGIMPTDFTAFKLPSLPAIAVVGREFNNISLDMGRTWSSSHKGDRFASVIHTIPTQCPYCVSKATIGAVTNMSEASVRTIFNPSLSLFLSPSLSHIKVSLQMHATTTDPLHLTTLDLQTACWPVRASKVETKQSYVFSVVEEQLVQKETIVVASTHGATSMRFDGFPPIKHSFHAGGGLGFGGSASIKLPDGGGYLHTAIVQLAAPSTNFRRNTNGSSRAASCPPTPYCAPQYCCPSWCRVDPGNRTSVIVFKSTDGVKWDFLSVLANASDHPESFEGLNEHDITLLPDGKTLMAAVRFDGGDGCSGATSAETQHYANYHSSVSTDMGASWSTLTPLPAGCARPRLATFGSSLVLTGGRHRNANTSDVLLWHNVDGRGIEWLPYSLSYHHNQGGGAASGKSNVVRQFDSRVNESKNFVLPRETNAYTSVFQVASNAFMVIYDQILPCSERQRRDNQVHHQVHNQVQLPGALLKALPSHPCMATQTYSMVVERVTVREM